MAGTVLAFRSLTPATTIPFSAAVLCSSAGRWTLRVPIRCRLHTDSTPRRGLNAATPYRWSYCSFNSAANPALALEAPTYT